jgi:L-lactate dehydrogenase complex protein LldF
MNVCPVYQTVSGHAYGSVYPGPIGSILTPLMNSLKDAKDLPFGSSLCGACSEICPVKINIHHTLLWLRSQSVESGFTPKIEKMIFHLWRVLMQNPKLYYLASKVGRFMQPLFMEDSAQIKVPVWAVKKGLPKFAEKSFREIWREEFNTESDKSKVESRKSKILGKVYTDGNL